MTEQDKALPAKSRYRVGLWFIAAVLLLTATAWWLRSPPATNADAGDDRTAGSAAMNAQPSSDTTPSATKAAQSPVDKLSHPAAAATDAVHPYDIPALVGEGMLTADAVKILLTLAESGRSDAMHELAYRLNRCRNYVGGNDESVRRRVLQRFYAQSGHEPSSEKELEDVAALINEEAAMLDQCRGLDPALMASRVDWMERAADGGDIRALLYYGSNALNDMRSNNDILTNLDEVVRRRQLARGYLQKALDRGACDALLLLSDTYSGREGPYNWLYKPDAYLSLVYADAAFSAGVINDVWQSRIDALADPAKRAAAAAQGAQLAARHCNKAN